MKVIPVPCLKDNYSYVLIDHLSKQVTVVDPVEPTKVLNVVKETGYPLVSLLTTHHHTDHSGGNQEMHKLYPDLPIYGSSDSRIPCVNRPLKDGDKFALGSLQVHAIATMGHTTSSISYYVEDMEERTVFSGDTLFIGGCGRLFEGTPQDMYESLVMKLGKLPKDTKVYCGHEYTLNNLRFAQTVDPENQKITDMLKRCEERRGGCTVPGSIGEERDINPFMRVHERALQDWAGSDDAINVLEKIRIAKDEF